MTTKNSKSIPQPDSSREIVLSRIFDAPRELVWEAMANAEHVAKWWGPRGFSTTIEEMEVRPGGAWKHVMRGPDGTEYPNHSVFQEVVKPERMVYALAGGKRGEKEVTIMFTWSFDVVDDARTKVTLRMVFPTAEERDKVVRDYGALEGGKQNLARLAEFLDPLTGRLFAISRDFDAPLDLVWKAWTEPTRVAQWWGPHNFTCPVCEMDVRPGGAYRITMRARDGREFPVKGVFVEIAEHERLVMTMDCSEHPPEWHDMVKPNRRKDETNPAGPLLQTVTFEVIGGKTRMTVRTRFASAEIRDAMVKMGMNDGWSQSLEKFAKLLSSGT